MKTQESTYTIWDDVLGMAHYYNHPEDRMI